MHVCDEVQQLAQILPQTLHGRRGTLRAQTSVTSTVTTNTQITLMNDESHPGQSGDHVFLEDGGLSQPCPDV